MERLTFWLWHCRYMWGWWWWWWHRLPPQSLLRPKIFRQLEKVQTSEEEKRKFFTELESPPYPSPQPHFARLPPAAGDQWEVRSFEIKTFQHRHRKYEIWVKKPCSRRVDHNGSDFPILELEPNVPSGVLGIECVRDKKQKAMETKWICLFCFPSILPDNLDKFFGYFYLTYQGKSDSMQNELCYFGIWSGDNNLPCGEWGFSQRAGPWRPLLCCSPRPFSTSRAPDNVHCAM